MIRRRLVALTLFWSATVVAQAHPPAGHVAVRAGRLFDGMSWSSGATLVLHGSTVHELRRDGSVPAGAVVLDRPGAVVTPGLVDLHASLGLSRGRDERHEALSPDLRVLDAFAPTRHEARAWRHSGVTTAWLAPGASGVLAGMGALVQPAAGERPGVLVPSWGPTGSLAAAARLPEREPTSLPRQAAMLRQALGLGLPGPPRVHFDDAASAAQARLLPGALSTGIVQEEHRTELAGAPVVVSGLGPWTGPGAAASAAALLARGSRVGFGSGTSPAGPHAIRTAAARCVQQGLDPVLALRALTSDGARLAGLPGDRGRLIPGAVADVVLWTGDPIDPSSRPLRVWVGGEEVLGED